MPCSTADDELSRDGDRHEAWALAKLRLLPVRVKDLEARQQSCITVEGVVWKHAPIYCQQGCVVKGENGGSSTPPSRLILLSVSAWEVRPRASVRRAKPPLTACYSCSVCYPPAGK